MKTSTVLFSLLSCFAIAACSNPCERLAKAVCEKAKDPAVCEKAKEHAKKAADAEKKKNCEAQLGQVDEVVEMMRNTEAAKKQAATTPANPAAPAPEAPPLAPVPAK